MNCQILSRLTLSIILVLSAFLFTNQGVAFADRAGNKISQDKIDTLILDLMDEDPVHGRRQAKPFAL